VSMFNKRKGLTHGELIVF